MLKVFIFIMLAVSVTNGFTADDFPQKRLKRMIARHDSNKDGKISRDEYLWRKETFDKIDADKDGFITSQELARSLEMRRPRSNANRIADIPYAEVNGKKMLLDLYMPKKSNGKPVLLIWIHGGGWTKGSKNNVNPSFLDLTNKGYAVASIDYQLLGVPGLKQIINECKGAIRFLRANAEKYGYNAKKIGVGGSSAGGHLALMTGTSGGVEKLEGKVGGNLDQSSSVQAVVDFFGPSDMVTQPRVKQMMGNKYLKDFAMLVSPVTYADKNDPPLLIYHGTADPVVPIEQSRTIHRKYRALGLESTMNEIKGGSHGFKPAELPRAKATEEMAKFFNRHLKP